MSALLSLLPAAQRVLIELAFVDGYTHREISSRTGLPLGTVKTRIRLALHRLAALLEVELPTVVGAVPRSEDSNVRPSRKLAFLSSITLPTTAASKAEGPSKCKSPVGTVFT